MYPDREDLCKKILIYLFFLRNQMIRKCHEYNRADHVTQAGQQYAVAVLADANAAVHQGHTFDTHVCDTMLESTYHEDENTPENHDQLAGFGFQFGTAPYSQTYQNVTQDCTHQHWQRRRSHFSPLNPNPAS